jgi:hypothetical protein
VIVCPLCQSQQAQGVECDVCGRPFPESMVADAGHAAAPVEAVPGLETTQIAEPPSTAPLPEDAPCNWCGHVQEGGRVCARCGMQRHRGKGAGGAAAAEADLEEGMGLCRDCGFPSLPPRCRNCGTRVVLGEEA